MSAMLDTYDMQVLDYSGDHDIQMHPSSSDQWFPDEAKMEEDGPTPFKDESDLRLNPHRYAEEKANGTIEVDMEPALDPQNTEYDMLDDDEIHASEIVDVEVYDASHAQSPAMFAADSAQADFFLPFQTSELGSASTETIPVESPNPPPATEFLDVHAVSPRMSEETLPADGLAELPQAGSGPTVEAESAVELSESVSDFAKGVVPHTNSDEVNSDEVVVASVALEVDEHGLGADEALPPESEGSREQPEVDVDGLPAQGTAEDESEIHLSVAELHPDADVSAVPGDNVSSGDPHEISEGVYIDPPPPVLLSLSSEDQFNFSIFNEPSTSNETSAHTTDEEQAARVLLSSFPTLYYEPLSTVFDALRQEECVQAIGSAAETELILEAVDLQLIISEDNIYAREVTLHDLNVLHDVSGIDGLLRMRLYTSTPRFITRYQHLQDEVSRLNLEPTAEDPSLEASVKNVPEEEHREVSGSEAYYETAQNNLEQDEAFHEELDQPAEGEAQAFSQGDDAYSYQDQSGQTEQEQGQEQAPVPGSTSGLSHEERPFDETAVPEESETRDDANSSNYPVAQDEPDLYDHDASHADEPNERDDEVETTTHHSTPTSGSLDIGAHPDDHEESEVIPLETVEANVGDDLTYDELDTSQSFNEEADVEYGDVYDEEQQQHQPDGTNEQEQEEYQEHQQARNQEDRRHTEEYQQTEANSKLDGPSDYQEGEASVDAGNVEEGQRLKFSDLVESKDELDFEQASTLANQTNFEEVEGDTGGDTKTSYEESVSTHTLEEVSHTEGAEYFIEPANDHALSHPDLLEDTEKIWEYDLDDEEDLAAPWDEGNDEATKSNSNTSSATLSSKASKRSYDEVDSDGEEYQHGDSKHWTPPDSPGPKRSRTQ